MSRPIDILLEFLAAEQAKGVTHVHLDEGARDGLRELFERSRQGPAPAAVKKEVPPSASAEISAQPVVKAVGGSKDEQLASLRRQAEEWEPARALGTLRDVMVFATGNPDARVMLLGDAPGYQEEKEREPFVGPAGLKLNDILKAMGLSRQEVYISNIVKFRPSMPRQTTNNRKPTAGEMTACMPLVKEEISIVRPECIIALGGTAAEGLLGQSETVDILRGRWHDFDGTPVRVTYHPSHLLQSSGDSRTKRLLWEDMLEVMETLRLPISEKQRGFFLPKK